MIREYILHDRGNSIFLSDSFANLPSPVGEGQTVKNFFRFNENEDNEKKLERENKERNEIKIEGKTEKKKESKDKSKDGGDKPDAYDDQKHADVSSSSRPNDLHPMASRDGTNDGTKEVPADTAVASASSTFGPKKSKGADPAKRQNRKRLAELARKQKEQERVKALITASRAAAPKSKKITLFQDV